MRVRFVPVPAELLPSEYRVVIVAGRAEVVIQLDEAHASPVLCAALTEAVQDFADSSWVYVGDLAQAG